MDRSVDGLVGGQSSTLGRWAIHRRQTADTLGTNQIKFCNQLHYMGFNLQLAGTMATYLVISKHVS